MKVLFFSSLAEITGRPELEISGYESVHELKSFVEMQYPGIKSMNYAIAVNKNIVHDNLQLNDIDEIAFLPPFSGG